MAAQPDISVVSPAQWESISENEIDRYAELVGDYNPIHMFQHEAGQYAGTKNRVVHGALIIGKVSGYFSRCYATEKGVMVTKIGQLEFRRPLEVGALFMISHVEVGRRTKFGRTFIDTLVTVTCPNEARPLIQTSVIVTVSV